MCANNLAIPMPAADRAILAAIEQDLLRPDTASVATQRAALQADLAQLEDELARLTAAIAGGGDLTS